MAFPRPPRPALPPHLLTINPSAFEHLPIDRKGSTYFPDDPYKAFKYDAATFRGATHLEAREHAIQMRAELNRCVGSATNEPLPEGVTREIVEKRCDQGVRNRNTLRSVGGKRRNKRRGSSKRQNRRRKKKLD